MHTLPYSLAEWDSTLVSTHYTMCREIATLLCAPICAKSTCLHIMLRQGSESDTLKSSATTKWIPYNKSKFYMHILSDYCSTLHRSTKLHTLSSYVIPGINLARWWLWTYLISGSELPHIYWQIPSSILCFDTSWFFHGLEQERKHTVIYTCG